MKRITDPVGTCLMYLRWIVTLLVFIIIVLITGWVKAEERQLIPVQVIACDTIEQIERMFVHGREGVDPQTAAEMVNLEVGSSNACGVLRGLFWVSVEKQIQLKEATYYIVKLESPDGKMIQFSWRPAEKPKGIDA